MWIQLAVLVISMYLARAMAPKPVPPEASKLGDFSVPVVSESTPVPVVFGTVWVKGPNVVWYGDLSTEPIIKCGGKK